MVKHDAIPQMQTAKLKITFNLGIWQYECCFKPQSIKKKKMRYRIIGIQFPLKLVLASRVSVYCFRVIGNINVPIHVASILLCDQSFEPINTLFCVPLVPFTYFLFCLILLVMLDYFTNHKFFYKYYIYSICINITIYLNLIVLTFGRDM